jgi:hypothetical protein
LRGTSSTSPDNTSPQEVITPRGEFGGGGVGAGVWGTSPRSGHRQHSNVVLPARRSLCAPQRAHAIRIRPGAGGTTASVGGVLRCAIAAATTPSGPRNKVTSTNVPRLSAGATIAATKAITTHTKTPRTTGTSASVSMVCRLTRHPVVDQAAILWGHLRDRHTEHSVLLLQHPRRHPVRHCLHVGPECDRIGHQSPPVTVLAHPPARQLALNHPMHLESGRAVAPALVGFAGEGDP